MSEKQIDISRRKLLAGVGTAGVAAAGAGLGTTAYLNDTESFTENQLTAGTVDLKVDWQQTYDGPDGLVPVNAYPDHDDDGLQSTGDGNEYDLENPGPIDLACGDLASGDELPGDVFQSENTPDDQDTLVSLSDVKPGDQGEITFSLHLCDNPAYLWLNGGLVSESENGVTEPEADSPNENDTPTGGNSGASLWPLAALAGIPALGSSDAVEDSDDDGIFGGLGDRRSLGKGIATAAAGTAALGAATGSASAQSGFSVSGGAGNTISAQSLAESLVGGTSDISIVGGSATYTGAAAAGGTFSGGSDVYGLDEGIILSSGDAEDIAGPNDSDSTSTDHDTSGDSDLEAIADSTVTSTNDAAILEFDFEVPSDADSVYFNYVFASDEYNEYVDDYNDVFGFFLNPDDNSPADANVALVNGDPVSINTINTEDNADVYNNNDLDDTSAPFDTEADGFTDVLQVEADVNPGETNTFKLAIADANDSAFDAWVLIEGESLSTDPDPEPEPEPEPSSGSELPDAIQARLWYDDGDNVWQDGDEEAFLEGTLREVLAACSSGDGVPLDGNQGDDFDELNDDPTAGSRGCFSAEPDVHYLGFEWWVPTDVGNEIQGDSVTFDLGFYAEQCRHNDGSGPSA